MKQKQKKLSVWYDDEGDYLEILFSPSPDTYFRELKKDYMQIIDKKTKQVIGYALFNFTKHKQKSVDVELPIPKQL